MTLVWDGTVFMRDASEIGKTLIETMLIVGLAVFLFMGSVRTALVPLVAMPISLIGAGAFMYAFGFSLNLLTILAIVLSVGLVVDDAIVVVENVERHVREGRSRREAALIGARELIGPDHGHDHHAGGGLRADRLPGRAHRLALPGVRHHAGRRRARLGIVAVTLSPVMSSRFVHEHGQEGRLTGLVNRGFDAVGVYARLLDGASRCAGRSWRPPS